MSKKDAAPPNAISFKKYDNVPLLSARDPDPEAILPKGFGKLYEVVSYRNAAQILKSSCASEFDQLIDTLNGFRIRTEQMVAGGKNKSQIAKNMEAALNPKGWLETRVQADLLIRKITIRRQPVTSRSGKVTMRGSKQEDAVAIQNFVDGHKIDFIKGRVAFDMEWNSKDQTFDRDLYAARTFYECGIISAAVLLTRSADLHSMFAEIGTRVSIEDYKAKFGASTTWMGKLLYRLDAGRGGGCPVLAIGIKKPLVDDFDRWRENNRVIRNIEFSEPEGQPYDDGQEAEEAN